MATVAAYIDGFNLYYGMKYRYKRKYLWLDVVSLIKRLRPDDDIVVVHYFTAIVKNEPAASQNQAGYIEAMKILNGPLLDVRLGRFKDRSIRPCRRCGAPYRCACPHEYRSFEEKGTDVALGATMVADAAQGKADTTVLVTADTDLAPALETVREVAPSQAIYLVLPPGNTRPSSRLTAVGNIGHFFIAESALKRSQMPPEVTDPVGGRSYHRPPKWS
jgi:uncharacterized LabA/DUF88 family protein